MTTGSRPRRSWVSRRSRYPTLVDFHDAPRGRHFAAWEEPRTFAEEMRAAFRTLR